VPRPSSIPRPEPPTSSSTSTDHLQQAAPPAAPATRPPPKPASARLLQDDPLPTRKPPPIIPTCYKVPAPTRERRPATRRPSRPSGPATRSPPPGSKVAPSRVRRHLPLGESWRPWRLGGSLLPRPAPTTDLLQDRSRPFPLHHLRLPKAHPDLRTILTAARSTVSCAVSGTDATFLK